MDLSAVSISCRRRSSTAIGAAFFSRSEDFSVTFVRFYIDFGHHELAQVGEFFRHFLLFFQ